MNNLIDTFNDVKYQIQRKRRQNQYGGMWGSTIDFFNGLNAEGQQQNNNGWEGNGGWGDNGWGQNMGNTFFNAGQLGLQMALEANKNSWGNNLVGFDWVI